MHGQRFMPCVHVPPWGGLKIADLENDGPRKNKSMKMMNLKMMDQTAGHENDGPVSRV